MLRRQRRTKLEIYYDILRELQNQSVQGRAKPTRIQQKCNMSYDKFSNNLQELKERKLVSDDDLLKVTDKGIKLLNDYGKINDFVSKMNLDYVELEPSDVT